MKPVIPTQSKEKSGAKSTENAEAVSAVAALAGQESEKDAAPESSDEKPVTPALAPDLASTAKISGPSPASLTEEKLSAAIDAAADKVTTQYRFISVYPNLTIYVYVGLKENVQGQLRDAPSRIRFKNGGFFTSDERVGKAMLAHPKCNTQLFRHVESADAAARMVVATQEQERMRTPTFSGVAASGDGNEAEYHQRQAILQRTQQQAFHG